MHKTKTQKGITLIALVITIIVMLILVGVTVTVALNGGLFTTAKKATADTELQRDKELEIANVSSGATTQDLIDKYKGTNQSEGSGGEDPGDDDDTGVTVPATYKTSIEGLATGVILVPYEDLETETSADIKAGVDAGKISAVLKEGERIAVVPTGYEVSTEDGEDSISEGLVIYDGASESSRNNEFVWIPVTTDFGATYTSGDYGDYSEPKYLKGTDSTTDALYDSQTTIDSYYGKKEDGSSYYTIYINSAGTNDLATNTTTSNGTTFDYGYHYNEMVTSVNKYDGFYIGRYETTIDGSNVGSKENATILSYNIALAQTNNQPVRWWGLYAVQRNSNVKGNGNTVQTNMIWGQQWDAMITFFDNENKDYSIDSVEVLTSAEGELQNAGQSKYSYNSEEISDKICNIFDLRGNTCDWTAEGYIAGLRTARGGDYYDRYSASYRNYYPPYGSYDGNGSRLTLYIK